MSWVLVIVMHVGALGSGNSNALTNVPGFKSKAGCEEAGTQVRKLSGGTVKEIVTTCVELK